MASYQGLRLRAGINVTRSITFGYHPEVALGSAIVEDWDLNDTARYTDAGGGLISSVRGRILGFEIVFAIGHRPLLTTDYVNGNKSILFDGATTYGRATGLTGLPTGATGCQAWVLHETVGAPSGTQYLVVWGGSSSGTYRAVQRSSVDRWVVSNGSVNAIALGSAGSTVGAHMSMGRWNDTVEEGRIRGAVGPAATTIATLNTSPTQITWGASNAASPASFYRGAISRIIITNDTLTLVQQQQLESWGYRKAGNLAALPADHPFKEGPDETVTFSACPTTNFIASNPATQPFHLDFRTSFLDQIRTKRAGAVSIYDADGNLVQVPSGTAAVGDHHPITHEPLGLASFGAGRIWNTDRTLATPQSFTFTSIGLPPLSPEITWFDTYRTFGVYGLGVGQVRLQFSRPVEVLRADGTSETSWGLEAITTTDITIDCIDPTTGGWFDGCHYFSMSRSPATTDVIMTKVDGSTIVHCEGFTGTAGPPTLTGISRPAPTMYSSWAATGLPASPTAFTFCQLTMPSHVMLGGQWITIDDNDANNTTINPITGEYSLQPVRSLSTNYISNPRFDNRVKDGNMGISFRGSNTRQTGVDPQTVKTEAMKRRCFFGTADFTTGEVAVCCNGADVERKILPLDYFPDHLRMVRWEGVVNGGQSPDGWLMGMRMEAASYVRESDATIQAFCSPTGGTGLFGNFDPS